MHTEGTNRRKACRALTAEDEFGNRGGGVIREMRHGPDAAAHPGIGSPRPVMGPASRTAVAYAMRRVIPSFPQSLRSIPDEWSALR